MAIVAPQVAEKQRTEIAKMPPARAQLMTGDKNMHAEPKFVAGADPLPEPSNDEIFEATPQAGHSLIDVLFPAKPPEPKNVRVILLFSGAANADRAANAEESPEE